MILDEQHEKDINYSIDNLKYEWKRNKSLAVLYGAKVTLLPC